MERRSNQSVEKNGVDVAETVDPAGGMAILPGLVFNEHLSEGPGPSTTIRHLTVLSEATALTYLVGTKFTVVRILS
jgi:hypothetical protein